VAALPEALDAEAQVYFCGYTAEGSFGATSYLVRRAEGNVLVDSPRAAGPLLRRLEELGGVRWMFLTHRDDVADHRRFRERFGCERILHARDVGPGTREVEKKLEGVTGDHLMGTEDGASLAAGREVCWYSWAEQIRSMRRLLDLRFEWVLPGHGGLYRAASPEAMRGDIERLLAVM